MKIRYDKNETFVCPGRFKAKNGEWIEDWVEAIGIDSNGNEYRLIWNVNKHIADDPDIIIDSKTGEYVTEETEIER